MMTRYQLLLLYIAVCSRIGHGVLHQEQLIPAPAKLITSFPLEHAAVCSVGIEKKTNAPMLLITNFFPTGTDAVRAVRNVSSIFETPASISVDTLETATQWPNQADLVNGGSQFLTASGFFVSGEKSTGSVDIFTFQEYPDVSREKVSEDRKGNFYHHAEYMDVDGDGDMDIVAARAFKSMLDPFSKAEGEMMWFERRADQSWSTRYLTTPQGKDGPDVSFIIEDLDNDSHMEFIASQFFTRKALSIWTCNQTYWSKCENGTGVRYFDIDSSGEPFFNVYSYDLNMDGKKEILATTNSADGKGAVYAYELQGNFRDGPSAWTRHTLATGYKPLHPLLPGQGSPGTALPFHRYDSAKEKPLILVSADDGGWIDMLIPTSKDQNVWEYNQTRLVTSTGTVGTMSMPMDLDGSGQKSFFVPLFSEGKVNLYKMLENA